MPATLACASVCLLLALACSVSAQTLARPGWNASGFNADPWWKHAVFYEVRRNSVTPATAAGAGSAVAMDWLGDSKTISAKLDAVQSLGADAVILPMPAQQTQSAGPDAFDELMSQASRRGIRVLLTFSTASAGGDLSARARFWLSRGVTGFYVVPPPQTSPQDSEAIVQELRNVANTAVGGRIVISNLPAASGSVAFAVSTSRRSRRSNVRAASRPVDSATGQLQVDLHLNLPELPDAATLRAMLAQAPTDPNVLLDFQPPAPSPNSPDAYSALSRAMAAAVLTTHPTALIDDANGVLIQQVDDGNSALTDWYRQLVALHHSNSTLRYGSGTALDFDAQNALVWVSRASAGTGLDAPVVVVCNLTSLPIHLSLSAAIRGLGLRGSFLRTLLRTDKGMGPQDLDSVVVPPFGVYIGELHR